MHITQSHRTALIITSLLLIGASAPSGAQLEADIQAWDAMSATYSQESAHMNADLEFQSLIELFPEATNTAGEGKLEDLRDTRIDAYVSVEVDGRLVVFSDVPRSAWFAPYVRDIAERKIVSGYRDAAGNPTGKFGPADNVTIEQMAKVMLYSAGHETDTCGNTINLTASGTWSAVFVACAEKKQWAVYGDGAVDVHRPATRAEVMMTFMEAFGKTPGERTGSGFLDVTMSTQFGSAIEQAKRDGVVSGYTDKDGNPTGLFGPEDAVTRAEFAKIVTLGIQLYGMEN